MPATVPRKPEHGGHVGGGGEHAEPLLETVELVQGGILDGLFDVLAGVTVAKQAGLHDRSHGALVLLADLDRLFDVAIDQQRLANLGQELVDVDLGLA